MRADEIEDLRILRDSYLACSIHWAHSTDSSRSDPSDPSRSEAYKFSAQWLNGLADRHGWW